ncbi:hypothetical protein [Bacillus cereus]|jgi:hypothetical protein|uniref:hypothetical protein n=1 Tax=Bacillus cereus TaxID=1396 RepID=UPI001145805F|nr:hypothetical protein [Bacillus cereus]
MVETNWTGHRVIRFIEVSSLECEALTQVACDLRLMEWGKIFSFQKMIGDIQATMKENLIP